MLDFSSIAKPSKVNVPVLGGRFIYHRKPFALSNRTIEDGWRTVEIHGNHVIDCGPHVWSGDSPNPIRGYTNGNGLVFQNFDVGKRKGFGLQAPLLFNTVETFTAIIASLWEDGRLYYVEPNYADNAIFEIKNRFEDEQSIDGLKGVTPELRTLFLFHSLERDQQRAMLEAARLAAAEQKRTADEAERMKDVAYRLTVTFAHAGARVLRYTLSGSNLIVDWELESGGHRFNSVIDSRTWMVREAGYCMTGDDRRHNITSVVKTAEDYESRRVVVITRNSSLTTARDDADLDRHLDNHYRDGDDDDDWG